MTREDIIRMARDAGWTEYSLLHPVEAERLERFATLVAAYEREECAKVCEARETKELSVTGRGAALVCAYDIRARGQDENPA